MVQWLFAADRRGRDRRGEMKQINTLTPNFVEFIPEKLDEGVLYISRRYRTASHLCCCGCGLEVVTPLNPVKWQLTEYLDGSVSLYPSVGNWGFPCKSHYFVARNQIRWANAMSAEQIAAVRAKDKRDSVEYARALRPGFIRAACLAVRNFVEIVRNFFR